jgi:5-methylcytosine-specific restriction endonuclease McrBC GTP-binding regulatory subunit McrB
MMTNNNSIITFEEILKLFGQLEKPKESALFHEKFPVFMSQKSEEDRQFIGTIMLSLTSDNAIKLMRDIV